MNPGNDLQGRDHELQGRFYRDVILQGRAYRRGWRSRSGVKPGNDFLLQGRDHEIGGRDREIVHTEEGGVAELA